MTSGALQYGDAELYYRIVHYRDASLQSMATIAAANRDMYQAAPVVCRTWNEICIFSLGILSDCVFSLSLVLW